jgi:hypothetical protein
MILPEDTTPKSDGIFGKDRVALIIVAVAIFLRGRIRDYALARADNPTRTQRGRQSENATRRRQRRQIRPGSHDACRSDWQQPALAVATRGVLHGVDGKMPPVVLSPQFQPPLPNGRDTPDLHLRSGIAIIPPPRPAFVGGKGSPCEKKKGSICEEES